MTPGDCYAAKERRLAEIQGYRSGVKSAGAVEIFAVTSDPYPEFTLYGYGPGGALALDAVWLDSLQVERLRPDFNHPTSKLIEVVFGYE